MSSNTRAFSHFTKAGHDISCLKSNEVDEIMFGLYHDSECVNLIGEFSITWVNIGKNGITPKLNVFSDAFATLSEFKDVLDLLATYKDGRVDPYVLTDELKKLGIFDNSL